MDYGRHFHDAFLLFLAFDDGDLQLARAVLLAALRALDVAHSCCEARSCLARTVRCTSNYFRLISFRYRR